VNAPNTTTDDLGINVFRPRTS